MIRCQRTLCTERTAPPASSTSPPRASRERSRVHVRPPDENGMPRDALMHCPRSGRASYHTAVRYLTVAFRPRVAASHRMALTIRAFPRSTSTLAICAGSVTRSSFLSRRVPSGPANGGTSSRMWRRTPFSELAGVAPAGVAPTGPFVVTVGSSVFVNNPSASRRWLVRISTRCCRRSCSGFARPRSSTSAPLARWLASSAIFRSRYWLICSLFFFAFCSSSLGSIPALQVPALLAPPRQFRLEAADISAHLLVEVGLEVREPLLRGLVAVDARDALESDLLLPRHSATT